MAEFGEFLFAVLGLCFVVMAFRVAWIAAVPASMMLSKWLGSGEMEWHRGEAKGRPPVRYIKDGWGRVVYLEVEPLSDRKKAGAE